MKVHSHALAFVSFLFPHVVTAKPNMIKSKGCQGNGRQCTIDADDFDINAPDGSVSQIDLGDGRNFSCRKSNKGKSSNSNGNKAGYHAECTSASGGQGAMNAVARDGKIFASVTVDGEICDIKGDRAECKPESAYPDEDSPSHGPDVPSPEQVFAPGYEAQGRRKFRELVVAPVEERAGKSLRGGGARGRRHLVDDLGGNLDLMVVWTKKAECAYSGLPEGCTVDSESESNMLGLIDLAIAETNVAYDNSGVNTQLRLVHAYRDESYVEDTADAFGTALNDVTGTNDGIMDDVHSKRTAYGADLVAMLIDDPAYCGLAWMGPSYANMFSVTAWNCATGYYSFAHEIGHNMGCEHDKGAAGQCSSTDYNFGYRDPASGYRSILAYNCVDGECDGNAGGGCSRAQFFSNPVHQYNGSPMGTTGTDNARRINDVAATIAAYEAVVPTCTSDADCDDGNSCTTNVCDGVCIYEPIDCDDGTDCTTDTCSGGTCINESVDCDDGNACTTDTCLAIGGCNHAFIPGCCGNGVCEGDSGEDATSCFEDCALGPFALNTGVCNAIGCYIQEGHMFDVEAIGSFDITITSLKMYTYVGAVAEVWTRPGSHQGYGFSSAGWTKVAEHDLTGAAAWQFQEVPESSWSQVVNIPAGTKQAFYITFRTGGRTLFHAGASSITSAVVQDENLKIYEGPSQLYSFGGQSSPFVWNGEFSYMKIPAGTPSPTKNPTDAPTPLPTPLPTPFPTGMPVTPAPTNNPTLNPTPLPTPNPTAVPTNMPVTPEPTNNPTPEPTNNPTPNPTAVPTNMPVTPAPTNNPTPEPTNEPTNNPTPQPTNAPTNNPTPQPTDVPTPSPTPPPVNGEVKYLCQKGDASDATICASGAPALGSNCLVQGASCGGGGKVCHLAECEVGVCVAAGIACPSDPSTCCSGSCTRGGNKVCN